MTCTSAVDPSLWFGRAKSSGYQAVTALPSRTADPPAMQRGPRGSRLTLGDLATLTHVDWRVVRMTDGRHPPIAPLKFIRSIHRSVDAGQPACSGEVNRP